MSRRRDRSVGCCTCCMYLLLLYAMVFPFGLLVDVPEYRKYIFPALIILYLIYKSPTYIPVAWNKLSKLSPSPEQMFIVSSIAILSDPFFLYIPIVDENNKCLGIDVQLMIAALVLRFLIDVPSLLHVIEQVNNVKGMPEVERSWGMGTLELQELQNERRFKSRRICVHIAIYLLAVLPIPQVMILVIFQRTPIIAYLVLQYPIRVYQIYQSCMKLKSVNRWLKGAFHFMLYILAAHVLGAFWYFLSIEREVSCWKKACKNTAGCTQAYYCSTKSASTNIELLNELCPINPSNATLFDFGIYLNALQSGNTGAVRFLIKYFYTFSWGFRNLSNFGTNLEPSSYAWENCFAIIISIIGLLLFSYLIGKVQIYMQMETQKSVLIEEKAIKKTYQAIDTWMSDSELPMGMKLDITKSLKEHKIVEKNRDIDVDINFLLSITPMALKNTFKEHICINTLKRVPMLQNMSTDALRMMCACAKPKVYHENSKIFNQGKRLDAMIVIIKGTIICSTSVEQKKTSYSKGDCYGEKLLEWKEGCNLTSDHDVHCQTKVEALVFTLESDLESFIDYWRIRNWDQNFTPLLEKTDSDIEIEKILVQLIEYWL